MTRRQWLGSTFGAAGGASFLGLINPEMLRAADADPNRPADSVILLWMGGSCTTLTAIVIRSVESWVITSLAQVTPSFSSATDSTSHSGPGPPK